MPLEHLFDAELEYRPGMAPLAGHGEGQLMTRKATRGSTAPSGCGRASSTQRRARPATVHSSRHTPTGRPMPDPADRRHASPTSP